jgi:hypothetical protein
LGRRLKERQKESEAFFAGAAGEWDRLRVEMYGKKFAREAMMALLPGGLGGGGFGMRGRRSERGIGGACGEGLCDR